MQRFPLVAAALAVALVLTGCDREEAAAPALAGDPLYPAHGNPALDVLNYDLDLTWAPPTRTLTGTAALRIRPVADATEIKLDFLPYALDRVTVDGKPARGAAVTGEKLVVPVTVTKDREVSLVVGYHGTPRTTAMPSHRNDSEPLGLTVSKDGGLWTMQEPYGAFTWYPANDHPSDEATYQVRVTVPAGWSAIAGGTPVARQGTTFVYRSDDPMATYLQTLAVGRYRSVTGRGPRGLPLTYWYRPGLDEKLLPSLRKSPQFLTFLEKHFGPYPFPTGGIVLVDSASGMETQQMITMGARAATGNPADFEEDLLHEYAHQWFGDSVTPKDWTGLWLSEGWAMYAQYLWAQSLSGASDERVMASLRQRDAQLRRQVGPPGRPKPGTFAEGNVYVCPAAMLWELNRQLGDEKFFALATAWVQTQRNTQQDRASFIAFVNRQTGRDFTGFVDEWLDSPTTPG